MKIRAISALIAVGIVAALYYFLQTNGLLFLCGFVAVMTIREYGRMTLRKIAPENLLLMMFSAFCFLVYLSMVYLPEHSLAVFSSLSILLLSGLLLNVKKVETLSQVTSKQGLAILGFFYCGICPAFATKILFLDRGAFWFIGFMSIVFAGDVLAYLTGRLFGKRKLLLEVSPKKTIEGSIGGLFGSCAAGALCAHFMELPHPWLLALLAIFVGLFAQVGDLFESLLKRVASVKDSGRLMPGHGGVLDRVDGIYFGAPVFYILVIYFYGASA